MTKQDHLVACGDGALYDTRAAEWSKAPPLRATFKRHCREIKTAEDLKACLRAGPYAWPGGCPLYFVTSDGGALSFAAARSELRQIIPAIRERDNSGWRIVAMEINYEDYDLYCDHTGEKIESAYGDAGV